MKNIIRSQIYQLVRNRNLRVLILAMIGLSIFTGAIGIIAPTTLTTRPQTTS